MRRRGLGLASGGLAALLLALSAFVPGPAAASVVSIGIPACTATTSPSVTCYSSIVGVVSGSEFTVYANRTGGTSASWRMVFVCRDNNSAVLGSTITAATGSAIFTSTIPAGCHVGQFGAQPVAAGSAIFDGTGVGTYESTSTVTPPTAAPQPTAAPVPTTTPQPSAPAPASASFTWTDDCLHGYRSTPAGQIVCTWNAWNTASGHETEPGNLFVDGYTSSPGHLLDGGVWTLDEPPGFVAAMPRPGNGYRLRPPEGMDAVGFSWSVNYGDADITEDATGAIIVGIVFFDAGGTEVGRFFEDIDVVSKSPDSYGSGQLTLPDGTAYVSVGVECGVGTVCQGFYGDYTGVDKTIRLDAIAVHWSATGSTLPPLPAGCPTITKPGFTNACDPSFVIDPNTFTVVCGPLSGDCAKPWLAPVYIPACEPPTSALDAAGWLAQIACYVMNLPAVIANVAIMAVNVIIDLLVPGRIDDAIEYTRNAIETRAIFAWVGAVGDAASGAFAEAGSSPVAFSTITFGSIEIEPGDAVSQAMAKLAPYRGILLAILLVGIVLKARDRVMSALNGGSVGGTTST